MVSVRRVNWTGWRVPLNTLSLMVKTLLERETTLRGVSIMEVKEESSRVRFALEILSKSINTPRLPGRALMLDAVTFDNVTSLASEELRKLRQLLMVTLMTTTFVVARVILTEKISDLKSAKFRKKDVRRVWWCSWAHN